MAESPDARSRILDAAERAFAEHGIAGARVAAIADDAGVNKAMLYYYFGSKDDLYTAALERVFELILGLAAEMNADVDGPPPDALLAFVDGYRSILAEHPYFVRLMLRSFLDTGPTMFEVLAPRIAKVLPAVAGKVAQGQARGVFQAEVDPRLVPPLVVAPMVFFALASPMLSQVSGIPAEELSQRWRDSAVELYLNGLLARPGEER